MFVSPLEAFASYLGFPVEAIKYLLAFLCFYPMASLFYYIHFYTTLGSNTKHLYQVAMGGFFIQFVFGWTPLFIVLIPSAFTFVGVRVSKHKEMPRILTALNLLFLVGCHLKRFLYLSPYDYEPSAVYMYLCIKLSTFAYDFYDLYSVDKRHSEASLLEFAGYVFLFPSVVSGPSCTFSEYRQFIDKSMFIGIDMTNPRVVNDRFQFGMKKLFFGLLYLVMFQALTSFVPVSYFGTKEFLQNNSLMIMLYLYCLLLCLRIQLYFVWTIVEGSFVLMGLGYSSSDGDSIDWSRMANIQPYFLETCPYFHVFVRCWNKRTQEWLGLYIHKRFATFGPRRGKITIILTYLISSVWHGLFAGYLLSFLSLSLITIVNKNFRKIFAMYKIDIGGGLPREFFRVFLFASISYCCVAQSILLYKDIMHLWGGLYHVGHITLLFLYIITEIIIFFAPKDQQTPKIKPEKNE